MKRVNKLLIPAQLALKESGIVDDQGKVKDNGVYEGYIAGFGAMVINLDISPTIAIYAGDDKRKKVLKAMEIMVPSAYSGSDSLANMVFSSENNLREKRRLKSLLMDVSIALKLMIRTFKIEKENG